MEVCQIRQNDDQYPVQLTQRIGGAAPASIAAGGNLDILQYPRIGLICSIQCPGSIVIKTFDVIRRLRDEKVVMIGGFYFPMARECFDLLLRGSQPVILCPARSLRNLRMGKSAQKPCQKAACLFCLFSVIIFGGPLRPRASCGMIWLQRRLKQSLCPTPLKMERPGQPCAERQRVAKRSLPLRMKPMSISLHPEPRHVKVAISMNLSAN